MNAPDALPEDLLSSSSEIWALDCVRDGTTQTFLGPHKKLRGYVDRWLELRTTDAEILHLTGIEDDAAHSPVEAWYVPSEIRIMSLTRHAR